MIPASASAPTSALPSLVVDVDVVSGRLTVAGGLDGRSARLLHDAVSTLLQADQGAWTVDVRELTVVDNTGLRAVIGVYLRAVRHDRRITLEGASPALQQALARLRLDRHLLPGDAGPPPG